MSSAYEILGVSFNATEETIRQAFRSLVRTMHPDRHVGDANAHDRFLQIKAAYEILSDPQRRTNYDLDPTGMVENQLAMERRRAQLVRRRNRLKKLYE